MQIIKDKVKEMDCVMIHQMLQARGSKNKGETVENVTKLVEGRQKDMQTKQEQERKQQVVVES